MAKATSGGGSVGGRRGSKIEANMDMSKAKALQNVGSAKPSLDTLPKPSSKGVTNKPSAKKVK